MGANPANPANWTAVEATAFANIIAAESKTPPEKRPLCRELPPASEFPIEAMGPLMSAAMAIHNRTQAPLAMCAQSVLAAATLACQAQRDVQLPVAGRKPLTGIFVSIAESGERKSTVDRLAIAGILEVEKKWRQESQFAQVEYANAKAAWDAARAHATRTSKGDMVALAAALAATGPEPKAPPHPMLIIADPTPEALTMHLAEGRPFAGLLTDEGAQLLGGAAFNDESRMRTSALLNILWDGSAIRRLRRSTGSTFLPGRRCTAHIMVQPVVADTLFGDSMIEGIGLLARVLLVAPNSTAGTRLFREYSQADESILAAYNERIAYLLARQPVFQPDMPDALDPPAMRLDAEARAEWIAFYDRCEEAAAPGGGLASIRAFAAKLAEHAARIAAVLALYHDPDAMIVPNDAMKCAVKLATFYANEMLRLHGGSMVTPDLRLAQKLLDWWRTQGATEQYLTRIYQFGPNAIRDASVARKAITMLEDHGWVERLTPGIELDGKPRKEAWRLAS